jgi:hypothetical protein
MKFFIISKIRKAMKKIITRAVLVILFSGLIMFSSTLLADAPPDPGGDPGGIGTPVGGGSPIGSGLIIMLSLAATYGGWKIFHKRDSSQE